MSGQLVGEVIAASDAIRALGVPRRGFLALIAIAEKARTETRQASVPWRHIQAVLYAPMPQSDGEVPSTAKRAVADLRDAGLVTVKRDFNNHNGRSAAPLYTISPLTELVTQVTSSVTEPTGHPDDPLAVEPTGQFEERTGQFEEPTGHPDDPLNGSTNGSNNGGNAREAEAAAFDWFDYPDDPPEDRAISAGRTSSTPAGPGPSAQSTVEPPKRCLEHADWDVTRQGRVPDCPGCRDARDAYRAWSAAADAARKADLDARASVLRAVDACSDCDRFGRLDDLTDCPRHANLRQLRVS